MKTEEKFTNEITNFDFQYLSLITLHQDGSEKILQFESMDNDGMTFNFNIEGTPVTLQVYDKDQYAFKKYMPEPKVIDFTKSIISPMPGAIISVDVQPGDQVVDGQQLVVMEAMKMQNIIKSEIEGTISEVNVKAGDSVAVDEILI